MKKVYIFMGPPGCGKGTQTAHLADFLKLPHIDTGSLLRAEINAQTPDGIEAARFINKGQLVPPELVGNVIKKRLLQDDAQNGYILDGFPRSMEQTKILEKIQEEIGLNIQNVAFYFDIDNDALVERLVNRRSCPVCGKIYNVISHKPKVEGKCDIEGAELIQRTDDNEETAKLRFQTYEKQTKPILDYFKDKGILHTVNADQPIADVWNEVKEIIA